MLERDLQRCLCFELGLLLELCIQEQPSNKNHQDRQHRRDQVHGGPSDGLFLFLAQVAHGSGQHLPKMYQSQLLAAITEHVFLCAHLKQSVVGASAGGATNVWMVVQGNSSLSRSLSQHLGSSTGFSRCQPG